MTTLVHDINAHIEHAMTRRGLDPRCCHTSVVAVPPAGHELIVESSDNGLLDELRGTLGSEGDVRWVALPREGAGLPAGMIAASSVVDVRRDPSHTSELRTQIVYGDAVEPLKDEGEWMLVRLDDGYVGWIRNWHLAAIPASGYEAWLGAASFRVATNHAEVLEAPQPRALPVTDLVIGTRASITTCGKRGWRAIHLADGREGFIQTRSVERLPRRRSVSRERLAATGLRFLGIPYIWGGTTPKGFDCSGLIQRIFRLNGRLLPRDADMQGRFGRVRAADAGGLVTGDLLFFGKDDDHITHVAMVLPDGLFLHAYGQVRVGSLDPRHPLYEPKLDPILRFARDPVSPKSA